MSNSQENLVQIQDIMIQLQSSLVNKLIKRVFQDKIVTSDFKKQFSKVLSLFIFYVQNGQQKKKYGESDILAFLEKEGLGKVAQDLRDKKKYEQAQSVRKKLIEQTQNKPQKEQNKEKNISQIISNKDQLDYQLSNEQEQN